MAARARVFLGCMIATPPAVYVHLFVTKPLFTTSYRNNCIPTVHSSASLEKSHTFAVAVADSAPCSSYYNMHIPPTDDPATAATTTTWKAIQHIQDEHTRRIRKEPLCLPDEWELVGRAPIGYTYAKWYVIILACCNVICSRHVVVSSVLPFLTAPLSYTIKPVDFVVMSLRACSLTCSLKKSEQPLWNFTKRT